MNVEVCVNCLLWLGVEYFYELFFDIVLVGLLFEEFVWQVLVDGFGIVYVMVGVDFCFGCKCLGNVQMLVELGWVFGFGVIVVLLIGDGENQFSLIVICVVLVEGWMQDVQCMLGYFYCIDGEVLYGDKCGCDLGYLMVNMVVIGLYLL